MTKLAIHGLRSLKDVQDLSEDGRLTYRLGDGRRSCAVYANAWAAPIVTGAAQGSRSQTVLRAGMPHTVIAEIGA
ncbi:hypothetical protein ABIB73_006586 [Bradyrhizobium sp. F1.4.3]